MGFYKGKLINILYIIYKEGKIKKEKLGLG
jgi:hypothetical protein